MAHSRFFGPVVATALAAAAAAGGVAMAQTTAPSSPPAGSAGAPYGPGMMGGYGRGMMGGYGYGRGGMMGGYGSGMMMGCGWRRGMMGGASGGQARDLKLSVGDVAACLNRRLAMMANPHIKLGPVVAKDADTIDAEIITTDKGGVVQRLEINRHNGFARPAEG